MKIKSFFLGSAAALFAFSGARAADAVIAEPEPVEYVRVCDAYGAGYFYLPGTETCLKVGGFVRYQIDFTDTSDRFLKRTVASIQMSAKSDTELGTLEGFMDIRTEFRSGAGTSDRTYIEDAYISLGGLKMGTFENAFDGSIVGEVDDLGGTTGNTISYTFASGGFDATIGLDEADVETNYIPNVSANAGFAAGAFAIRGFIAYDEERSETAAKLRIGADVTEGGRFEIAGIYSTGVNYSWGLSEWSIAAGYQQKVSDQLTVVINAQYWSGVNGSLVNGPTPAGVYSDADGFAIGGNIDWKPVKNFLVRTQLEYNSFDGETVADADNDFWTARVRFQRSF